MAELFPPVPDDAAPDDVALADGDVAGLNPDQLDAVLHRGGPLLVVAGAGSGKTRVLTHRIAHLIAEDGLSPMRILAITFTNKAADEMRHRLVDLVGPVARKMWISTFHAACVRMLRARLPDADQSNAELLGYPRGFSIYDQADSQRLVGYCVRDLRLDTKRFAPRAVQGVISLWKNELIDPTAALASAENIFVRKQAEVYAEYQTRLRRAGAMDFDDLLMRTVELLQRHPEVLAHYQQLFQHILIDEYQDTNHAQNQLVILLGAEHRNVCVVGDVDQCFPVGTRVTTIDGDLPIEGIEPGDQLVGSGGRRDLITGSVRVRADRWYRGPLVRVRTTGGRELTGTPGHLLPARLTVPAGKWIVYLMHRVDRGYRVGLTATVRSDSNGRAVPGFFVPSGQERADAIWILRVCDSRGEAGYWEAWYSAQFGLPTACFHGNGQKLAMDDDQLAQLSASIDTEIRAKELLEALQLFAEVPHDVPQNGARQTLNLTMFSDHRSDPGEHQLQWGESVRFETRRTSWYEALAEAGRIAAAGGLRIRRRMSIGGTIHDLHPMSHLHPGMTVLALDGDELVDDVVASVEFVEHDGPVHDVEVEPTHSYIANGLLVHNSVYRFRGADFRNILEFEQAFGDATTIVLAQNYRSTQTVLDAANAVIAHNLDRKPKDLWTDKGHGDPIVRYTAEDEHDEASWVIRTAKQLHDEHARNWREMAVFYRTNAQSRVVEEACMRHGIPYKVIGGTRFYDRREIRDALAYLRAAANPADEVSLKRILNVPKRGIGDASIARIDELAATQGISFFAALCRADEADVSGPASRGIASFVALLDDLSGMVANPELGPADVLEAALAESGYLAELDADRSVEAEGRRENLDELIGSARQFTVVDEFLEQVSLVADTDELDADDRVVLMTLHAAKGLEFPVVFLVGLEEGVFPHQRAIDDPTELEEERRLAYVGITRAQEQLFVTHAWSRTLFGATRYNPVSRFIEEIPAELVHRVGMATQRASTRQSYRRDPGYEEHRERVVDAALAAGRRGADRAVTAPQPSNAQELGLRVGDDVSHPTFGEGVIIEIRGQGEKAEATVRFREVGTKHLSLAWAPLTALRSR
jgi:DNA helicase-2/ATP-dependent DNA helicase PcrA